MKKIKKTLLLMAVLSLIIPIRLNTTIFERMSVYSNLDEIEVSASEKDDNTF